MVVSRSSVEALPLPQCAVPMSPDHNTHRLNTSQPTSHKSLHTIPRGRLASVEAILSYNTGVTSSA